MSVAASQKSLADFLRERELVSAEALAQALARQKESGQSLDQTLLDLGLVTEEDLVALYSELFHIRYVKLEDVEIDREAVKHVPAAVAHRHRLIPVRRSGNTLAVAMSDPTSAEALAALKSVTDFDVLPLVARQDAIEHALFLHYGKAPLPPEGEKSDEVCTLYRLHSALENDRVGQFGRTIQPNRRWTFDTFVSDAKSQFAFTIARTVAEQHSGDGNLFHVWGPAGTGKSHLLHAIANQVTTHAPLKRFVLTSGPYFCESLFESLRDKKINFFRYFYRELDLILLDDADALITKPWAQLELEQTFEHLRRAGRMLVLAARTNLATETRIVPALRSVIATGIVAQLETCSAETCAAIVRRFAAPVELAPAIVTDIIARSAGNVRHILAHTQDAVVAQLHAQHEPTMVAVEKPQHETGRPQPVPFSTPLYSAENGQTMSTT